MTGPFSAGAAERALDTRARGEGPSAAYWTGFVIVLAAAVVAMFVAFFSTRLRDIYFSITTLVFSQIFYVVIFTWTDVTGGENGLTFQRPPFAIPGLLSLPFTRDGLHWFVLGVVTVS